MLAFLMFASDCSGIIYIKHLVWDMSFPFPVFILTFPSRTVDPILV